ncbi:MAG: UDP-N-acetylglucosamine 2-epimerase (non-hydrolyzing) [Candidatus Micrarchaeota archaeon]|nr:UDP-N-acetylglucosamine 2-epimerase (non-hydrolyzing) [Candidatus Micrarchaeota archaeon]
MGRILVFIGTRPEILKMAPVIRALDGAGADFKLIFSGQHYDRNMSKIFFEEFQIREPDEEMRIGGQSRPEQIASCIKNGAKLIKKEAPDTCVVNGDTNTTLGCALAAVACGVPYSHIEAGCRSFDFNVPEEFNRVLVDRAASLLFPPTYNCLENLLCEGIPREKCLMFGNTAVDTFNYLKKKAMGREVAGLPEGGFVLVTLHRQENVDNKGSLRNLVQAISQLEEEVVFPMHPRTRKNVNKFGLWGYLKKKNIRVIEPVGYLDFLSLLLRCRYVISDSGGVVEEAALAKKRIVRPCTYVEWYEVMEEGIGVLCRPVKDEVLRAVERIKAMRGFPNVYPDLHASERIAKEIVKRSGTKFETRDFIELGRPRLCLDGKGRKQVGFDGNGFVTFDGKKQKNCLAWVDYR